MTMAVKGRKAAQQLFGRSERSEKSRATSADECIDGFFAALRMTDEGEQ
jgi:hypothetical protein